MRTLNDLISARHGHIRGSGANCGTPGSQDYARDVPPAEITVDELAPMLDQGVALVDVRMPDEYEEVRVPGALLIPLPELPDRLDEVSDTAVTYVICRSGARSAKACQFLTARGHEAINVAGGTLAWVESGRPTDSGPIGG